MKRFLLVLLFLLLIPIQSYGLTDITDIANNISVYYSPETRKWSKTPTSGTVCLNKRYTVGVNKYSEYVLDGLGHDSNSTQEFIFKGDLIGYNKNTLKFHRLYFEEGVLKEERLNEKELKEIFPKYEIIRVSQFKDNTIKIKRSLFKKKTYMLLNDTNRMFYGYWFKGVDNTAEAFNCIFTPSRNGKIDFLPYEKSFTYTPYYIRLKYVL